MSCSRSTVRKILRRYKKGAEKGIWDDDRRGRQRRGRLHIEWIVIAVAKKTGYGLNRIERILSEQGMKVKASKALESCLQRCEG